jgi:hypothetical protein
MLKLTRVSPSAGERRCMVRIDADGPSSTSWYEVWEAVNAISYMCVRSKGKGGKATKIGRLFFSKT